VDGCRWLARALRMDGSNAEALHHYALALSQQGDAAAGLAWARRALALAPALYGAHAAAADALERLGSEAALVSWERAILCQPGFGEGFTRRALLLTARRWGAPPVRAAAPRPGRRLACSTLGRNGRFGNQLLQYGFVRLYAQRHDLDLEVPLWLGRHLFDADDPLPGSPLPRLSETDADLIGSLNGESPQVYAERDIEGYFCGDTRPLARHRDAFRALFRPGRHLAGPAEALRQRLRSGGRTVVALHLRRGDFGWGRFWVAPEAWYQEWLRQIWPQLDRPLLYVASDSPACAAAFAEYRPLTAADMGEPIAGAEFLTDFLALASADLLAISNSSFSFVASMLNEHARATLRPDQTRRGLVAYDPWAAPVLL
jgi:hypothetical protein